MSSTSETTDRTGADLSPLSAATATRRERALGVATILASSASNQTGAAIGATAFAAIGPVGVVAVRQLVTAAVLGPSVRPRFRSMSSSQLRPVVGLALAFSVMNLGLYAAVDRIGLGLAVTLEFLGPLAVAVGSSRRAIDVLCAVIAGIGVVVLVDPGPSSDVLGIGLALMAAAAWAAYILLNRELGRRLPGLQGTAAASVLSGLVWLPIAAVWFGIHPPTLSAVLLAIVCGLMASVVPFAGDLLALRRVSAGVFGTLTSLNPVWAAVAGWLILQQALAPAQWSGIVLIVLSNAAVTAGALLRRGAGRPRPAGAGAQTQAGPGHLRRSSPRCVVARRAIRVNSCRGPF